MSVNPVRQLGTLGQSVWLDFIERRLLNGGGLRRLIEDDGVCGVTTNPTIFDNALASDHEYAPEIACLAQTGHEPPAIAESLMREDVMHAADILWPVYRCSRGMDGFVSLEISPRLAHNAEATIAEAEYVWSLLDRPNAMIKVPATKAGVSAMRTLIAGGVNVNATLIFSVARYLEVAEAYRAGLEARAAAGRPVDRVASVASFFISRIDTAIDKRLAALRDPAAAGLRGAAAIACARLAYREFERLQGEQTWQKLAARGARPQRLLWASTSTKDPRYDTTRYVEALAGPQTVNTMTEDTLNAYRDSGKPAVRIREDLAQAERAIGGLAALGIDVDLIAVQLEADGVRRFAVSEAAVRERVASIVRENPECVARDESAAFSEP